MRAVMLLAALAVASCGPSMVDRAQTVINNPAGQNCTDRGGRLVIRQSNAGQKGFCQLGDGRTVDIWEYLRQTNP